MSLVDTTPLTPRGLKALMDAACQDEGGKYADAPIVVYAGEDGYRPLYAAECGITATEGEDGPSVTLSL